MHACAACICIRTLVRADGPPHCSLALFQHKKLSCTAQSVPSVDVGSNMCLCTAGAGGAPQDPPAPAGGGPGRTEAPPPPWTCGASRRSEAPRPAAGPWARRRRRPGSAPQSTPARRSTAAPPAAGGGCPVSPLPAQHPRRTRPPSKACPVAAAACLRTVTCRVC